MKKIIFITIGFILIFFVFAMPNQKGEMIKQARTVAGNFSKLKVSNAINVVLTMGEKDSVVVESYEKAMQYIKVEQIGNELSLFIANQPKKWRENGKVTIYVNAKNLDTINVSGASTLNIANGLETDSLKLEMLGASKLMANSNMLKIEKLDLHLSGASVVDMNIEVQEIKSVLSGASKLNLIGSVAKTFELDFSGASKLNASDLSVVNYNCDMSGASTAAIWCTGNLNVKASGASSLTYKGEPTMQKMETSGVSLIKQSN